MNLLLDECVLRELKRSLSVAGHVCSTVPEAGFASKTNGELLSLAEQNFDVFVTLDTGLQFQQNLTERKIAILVIRCKSRGYSSPDSGLSRRASLDKGRRRCSN